MAFFRSLLYYFGSIIAVIVIVSIGLLLFFCPAKLRYQWLSQWCIFNIWWLKVSVGLSYRVHGFENIPKKTCVIVSNHQSTWETFSFFTIFPRHTWVLKKQLLYIPYFGWGLALLKPIVIDRQAKLQALKKIIKQGCQRIKENIWVVIFPEGTRKPDGQLGHYQSGAISIAKSAKCDILPVYHNAGRFWPKGRFIKHKGCIDIIIGEVINHEKANSSLLIKDIENWAKDQQEIFKKVKN